MRLKPNKFKRITVAAVTAVVVMAAGGWAAPASAQMIAISKPFAPVILRGIKFDPQDPFRLEFIIDEGDTKLTDQQLEENCQILIRYFFSALTIPADDLWVNLSPYESNRIVAEAFGLTDLGKDMLAQDYLLKQFAASLTYPETKIGKQYWDAINNAGSRSAGTADQSCNKVWVVPDQTEILESGATAIITKNSLKVMSDNDYLAVQNDNPAAAAPSDKVTAAFKTCIIPSIDKEVNQGKNFAALRQIHNAIILAGWFKNRLKDSIYNQLYIDKKKINGIKNNDPLAKDKIYNLYLEAFSKGVYNYMKHESAGTRPVPLTGFIASARKVTKRQYFCGGINEATAQRPGSYQVVAPSQDALFHLGGKIMIVPTDPAGIRNALVDFKHMGPLTILDAFVTPAPESQSIIPINASSGVAMADQCCREAISAMRAGDKATAVRKIIEAEHFMQQLQSNNDILHTLLSLDRAMVEVGDVVDAQHLFNRIAFLSFKTGNREALMDLVDIVLKLGFYKEADDIARQAEKDLDESCARQIRLKIKAAAAQGQEKLDLSAAGVGGISETGLTIKITRDGARIPLWKNLPIDNRMIGGFTFHTKNLHRRISRL